MNNAWESVSTKEPLGLLTLLGLPGMGVRTVKLLVDRLDVLGAVHAGSSLPLGVSAAAARSLQDVEAVVGAHAHAAAAVGKAEGAETSPVPLPFATPTSRRA